MQSAVAPRLQGDDLDHHAGAAVGDREPEQARPPVEAEARRVRPVRARGRGALRDEADQLAILNEPNQPGWLQPQSNERGFYAPHHYRRLVNAAFPAIRAASPGDTILVGELAASGSVNRGPRFLDPAARLPARVRLRDALVPQAPHRPLPRLQGRRARTRSATTRTSSSGARRRHSPQPRRRRDRRRTAAAQVPRPARRARRARSRPAAASSTSTTRSSGTRPTRPTRMPASRSSDRTAGSRRRRTSRGRPRACTPSASSGSPTARSCPGGGFDAYREFQTGLMFRDMRPKPSYASFRHPFVDQAPREAAAPLGPGPPRRPPRRHRSSASGGGSWKQVATRDDDPSRLLAAQDPQALGHLPLPLGLRRATTSDSVRAG